MKLIKFRFILLYSILDLLTTTFLPCLSLSLMTSSSDLPGCRGRVKMNGTTGYITDGPSFYSINLQCIWLIDSGTDNTTITLHIHRFNTECNYDYLYILDGDSINSPMVAALSGDMKDFNSNSINYYQNEKFNSPKISIKPRFESMSSNNNDNNNINNNINRNNNEYNTTTSYNTSNASTITPLNNKDYDNNNSLAASSNHYGRGLSLTPSHWQPSQHNEPFEIRTYSGKAFIYFHSDTAQSMPGFYITYSLNSCPNDCSEHGECNKETSTCKCNPGYHGASCQLVDCPNNCTSGQQGYCDNDKNCICHRGYQGADCSMTVKPQIWTYFAQPDQQQSLTTPTRLGRSQHQAVVIDKYLWALGGRTKLTTDTNITIYKKRKSIMVKSFDLDEARWTNFTLEGLTGVDHLAELSGHSCAVHGQKIYIYGGISLNYTILDTLTVLDTQSLTITTISSSANNNNNKDNLKVDDKLVPPIASVGHSANIINDNMYVFSGFNPVHGYLNLVQKYNIKRGNWSLIERRGTPLIGCIGHTSTYDPIGELIYLYGGHNAQRLSNLYSFDLKTETWSILQMGPSPRYYHSALIIDRQLIILGGNSYNTSHQTDQCFQDTNLIYDLNCGTRKDGSGSSDSDTSLQLFTRTTSFDETNCEPSCWTTVRNLQPSILKRHGQSVVNYKRNLVLLGGFNGMLLNDLLIMPIGSCQNITEENECNRPKMVLDCSWNVFDSRCENKSDMMVNSSIASLHNPFGSTNCAVKIPHSDITSTTDIMSGFSELFNEAPCNTRHSCNECVQAKCIWCSTSEQCIDSTAYFAYHPMGQCLHYVAHPLKCSVASCSDIESCDACLSNPKCGWLNDISNTGKGKCLEGTSMGPSFVLADNDDATNSSALAPPATTTSSLISPLSSLLSSMSLTSLSNHLRTASAPISTTTSSSKQQQVAIRSSPGQSFPNWHYTSCPACQCNGHSHCKSNSSSCIQCQDNTEGAQCDRCLAGYYGEPLNGNSCQKCRCNGHANTCNRETGKCYCSTKGIIGRNCNKCDEQNHYIGDPLSSNGNGTCYYNLTTDWQYTFNMSKPEDYFYSQINFVNIQYRRDSDVDFTIACSKPALVNITSGINYVNRKIIYSDKECGTIRLRIAHDKNDLSPDTNISFYVHVHKFQTPFILQIAFSQHKSIYLPQIFFTFSSFFLFFLILSGVLWKIKIEYDSYVRRQRQTIEMQQMASRPFSSIFLNLFESSPSKKGMVKIPSSDPTPISFEPCFGDNIGILSVFVQLPGGGKPNLAVGSALVSLAETHEGADCQNTSPTAEIDQDDVVYINNAEIATTIATTTAITTTTTATTMTTTTTTNSTASAPETGPSATKTNATKNELCHEKALMTNISDDDDTVED